MEGLDRLDGLVHVAAVGGHWSADEATLERWHEQFDTNVIAPAELTRLTLPLLRRAQGHVVFIGSGASRVPVPGSVIYAPSKHALRAYAEALRDDESPHRVRVTSLEPGPTATDMGPRRAPAEALIQPASVAAAVRFALDSPPDVDITVVAVRPRGCCWPPSPHSRPSSPSTSPPGSPSCPGSCPPSCCPPRMP